MVVGDGGVMGAGDGGDVDRVLPPKKFLKMNWRLHQLIFKKIFRKKPKRIDAPINSKTNLQHPQFKRIDAPINSKTNFQHHQFKRIDAPVNSFFELMLPSIRKEN